MYFNVPYALSHLLVSHTTQERIPLDPKPIIRKGTHR